MSTHRAVSLTQTFTRALETILARVSFVPSQSEGERPVVGVALSGGLDSTVLLHLSKAWADQANVALHAFHIHHGLQVLADEWPSHCERLCARLGVSLTVRYVTVDRHAEEGVEAAARLSRYAALSAMCREKGVSLLLTAHHQDDQAETVLLHLMRGTGVAGLAGMEMVRPLDASDTSVMLGRPLLAVSRGVLEAWAASQRLPFVEDPSNKDVHLMRNAVRREIIPVLQRYFPAVSRQLQRMAQHARTAQTLLDELAVEDLRRYAVHDELDRQCLDELSPERADNLLRYWLGQQGVRMPSTLWLSQARQQLKEARVDAQIKLELDQRIIRRYRNRIMLETATLPDQLSLQETSFIWQGEKTIHFPEWQGMLCFEEAKTGLDSTWLRTQTLHLVPYQGNELLKLAASRYGRTLKQHYQSLGIPAWKRVVLPSVYAAQELIFAAGIGMAWSHIQHAGGIRMRWEADSSGLSENMTNKHA